MKLFGAMVHPKIFISKNDDVNEWNDFENPRDDEIFSKLIGNREIHFFHSGYVLVNTDSIDEAEDILNALFFSIKLLKFGELYISYVKKKEIDCVNSCDTSFNHAPLDFNMLTFRNAYTHFRKLREELNENPKMPKIRISQKEVEIACELADEIIKSEGKEGILTFIECYSEMGLKSRNAAFLLGIVAIEIWLFVELRHSFSINDCKDKLGRQIKAADVITKLRNGLISERIKFEENDPTIFDEAFLDSVKHLLNLRNKIVHGEKRNSTGTVRAEKEESEECLRIATAALWRLFRLANIKYASYISRMQQCS